MRSEAHCGGEKWLLLKIHCKRCYPGVCAAPSITFKQTRAGAPPTNKV